MRPALVMFVAPLFLCGWQSGAEVAPPASRQDVWKLEKELRQMRRQASEAERKSVARSARERNRIIEENRAAVFAAEKKIAEKLESVAREARKRSDDQLRTQRTVWLVVSGAVLIGMLVAALLMKKIRRPKMAVFSLTETGREGIPETLVDPDIFAIREALFKKGKQKLVLYLQDGRQVDCVAELKSGEPFITEMEGKTVLVGWDKRRKSASKIVADKI